MILIANNIFSSLLDPLNTDIKVAGIRLEEQFSVDLVKDNVEINSSSNAFGDQHKFSLQFTIIKTFFNPEQQSSRENVIDQDKTAAATELDDSENLL